MRFSRNRLKAQIRRLMPRSVRPHRILAGPLRGRVIVTSWHDYPGAILGRTERPLLDWFARNVRPNETWLDVGAHYGYTAIALSELVGPGGRVFAFEPVLSTAGHLARTRVLNRLAQLAVLPFGLGEPDVLTLKNLPIVRGMADSTLQSGVWREGLIVARLDSIWSKLCDGKPGVDGVKIDVQGMEIATLKGMAGLLRDCRPRLVVELHAGVDRGKLLDLIQSLGYRRMGEPIEGEAELAVPRYLDDRSYSFSA